MFKVKEKLGHVSEHKSGSMTLYDTVPGKKYRILRVEGGCKLNCHLCAMGLVPNEVFTVYSSPKGGPLCISIKGSKFAIGRGMMERLIIKEA